MHENVMAVLTPKSRIRLQRLINIGVKDNCFLLVKELLLKCITGSKNRFGMLIFHMLIPPEMQLRHRV